MPRAIHHSPWPERLRFGILATLVTACFIGGGASRVDVLSLIYLQPFAVLCLAALLLVPGSIDWPRIRVPLLLMGGLATIMMAQLIPLPPALWAALPGHSQFAEIAQGTAAANIWRPISLTPDLTLDSLVGLVVPAAVLIGFAAIPTARTYSLLPILLFGAGLSIFIGILQVSGGEHSAFYPYAVTNRGLPVGLFSNRNHEALLLVLVPPMLAVWASRSTDNRRADNMRRSVAAATITLLFPMLLITGSRAGIALAPVGLLLALAIWRNQNLGNVGFSPRTRKLLVMAVPVVGILIIGIAISLSRDEAIRRFLETSFRDESRLQFMPVIVRMFSDFFPLGSGFGSFDPVYRFYEPDALLVPNYLNHAHNDLLELLMTGGLPALLLLLVFLVWAGRAAIVAFRDRASPRRRAYAWLATGIIVLTLASSLVDYPLRTPLMAVLFVLACGWIGQVRRAPDA